MTKASALETPIDDSEETTKTNANPDILVAETEASVADEEKPVPETILDGDELLMAIDCPEFVKEFAVWLSAPPEESEEARQKLRSFFIKKE
jgi:hypothetical protein